MASNIAVKVTVDVTEVTAQMAVARAELNATNQTLRDFAKTAQQSGMTNELKAQLTQAAEASVAAKAKVADLSTEMKALQPATQQASGALSAMKGGLESVVAGLGALGVAFSVEKVIEFGKTIFDNAANLQRTSDALGITTDQLQSFQYAARESGVDTQTADAALQKFYIGLGQAEEGTGPALKAFQDLGLNVGQLAADQDNAAAIVAQALLKESNQYERAAHIREIYSKGGKDMNALLVELAKGYDANLAAAKRDGEYTSGGLTQANLDAEKAMDKAWTKIKVDLTPAVTVLGTVISGLTGAYASMISFEIKAAGAITDAVGAVLSAINPWHLLTGEVEGYNKATGAAAHPKAPPTPEEKKKTAEQIDVAGLTALDGKLRERKVLTNDIATAQRTLAEAQGVGDVAGIKSATTVISDLKKQLDGLNKAPSTKHQTSGEDAIATARARVNEIRIQGEEATNAALLQIGSRSLDEFVEQAHTLENARYQAALDGAKERARIDAGDKLALGKDLVEQEGLLAEHNNRAAAIDQQAAQKRQQQRQTDFQDFSTSENEKLQAEIAGVQRELAEHMITARQAAQLEIGLTRTVEQEVLNRFDAEHAGLQKGTQAYAQAMKEREALTKEFSKQVQTYDKAATVAEMSQWNTLGKSIQSGFNGAIDGMVLHGDSFKTGMSKIAMSVAERFLHMGENMLENWIETQVAQELFGKATASASSLGQITAAAGVAAANTFASISAIPIVGPALAPAAAAAAAQEVMSFSGLVALDTGTNYVPANMPAMIHQGERVVPRADNEAMIAAMNGGTGRGDTHLHYSPTIHAGDVDLPKLLQTHSRELVRVLKHQQRIGAF